ncbi:MAG: hypothetical protein GF398_09550 [Chitinivibrionales bacterium]|nr:hypothetical protein [Chitinivibrionales bacterium]
MKLRCTFALILTLIVSIPAAERVPIISRIGLTGGKRGLALAIESDGGCELNSTDAGKNKSGASARIDLRLSNVIYGLEHFSFESFPAECPVSLIRAKETSAHSVTFSIKMSGIVGGPAKKVAKGNSWLVLLSSQPCAEFRWTSSGASREKNPPLRPEVGKKSESATPPPKKSSRPSQATKAESKSNAAVATKKPARLNAPAKRIATKPKKSGVLAGQASLVGKVAAAAAAQQQPEPAMLENLRFEQQGEVERISAHFSSPVSLRIKHEEGMIKLAFENASSALNKDAFRFKSNSFKEVRISTMPHENVKWLRIFIDLVAPDTVPTVARQESPDEIAVYGGSGDTKQIRQWSADNGVTVKYDYKPVETGQDKKLSAIEQKLAADAEKKIRKNETFSLGDRKDGRPEIQKKASAPPQPPRPEKVVVIKDGINLRSEPSTRSKETIVARLDIGTMLLQTKTKGTWLKVTSPDYDGWIYAPLVQDSADVSPALWKKIGRAKNERLAGEHAQQPPEPKLDSAATAEAQPDAIRDSVIYRPLGRDPFLPLSREEAEASEYAVIENVKLVGILYDTSDKLALLQDRANPGSAYALKEKDPIRNGIVLRIEKDQVVFLINELDYSQTFTMKLNKEKLTRVAEQKPDENGGPLTEEMLQTLRKANENSTQTGQVN